MFSIALSESFSEEEEPVLLISEKICNEKFLLTTIVFNDHPTHETLRHFVPDPLTSIINLVIPSDFLLGSQPGILKLLQKE